MVIKLMVCGALDKAERYSPPNEVKDSSKEEKSFGCSTLLLPFLVCALKGSSLSLSLETTQLY